MLEIKSFFIVSRYNEDVDWIHQYTDNYVIYNKGEFLEEKNVINVPNHGGNQFDIFRFAHENYYSLPETMVFVQANPFDHCKKETFDKMIYNEKFTSIEDYSHIPESSVHKKSDNGGYMEINNSWYISAHNGTWGLTCKYESFDDFMHKYFKNYKHIDFIRFCPGSQYIIERDQIQRYPLAFWSMMMSELPEKNMTEAHIIERALWYILTGAYDLREDFYVRK